MCQPRAGPASSAVIQVETTTSNAKVKKPKIELDPLNDLIGQYGLYHFNVSLFIILREAVTALDSLVFALSLPTLEDFQCLSDQRSSLATAENIDTRCYYMNNQTSNFEQCQDWKYFEYQYKDTLTVQWDLVCHREWLGPVVHSSYFLGWLLGSFLWGPLADKLGRWGSHTLCHILCLVFGAACLLAPNIYWLLYFRFASAFCTIGYSALNTLQVEITGTRCRSFITTANHFGWGLGVVIVGFIGQWTNNWRYLAAISPAFLLISLPWLLILPESIRWQVLNKKFDSARKEIKRASAFNRLSTNNNINNSRSMDDQIDAFFAVKKLEGEIDGGDNQVPESRMLDLFTKKSLLFNLLSLWGSYLATSYIYYSRTIHFGSDKESMFVNFLITGVGEWVCLGIAQN